MTGAREAAGGVIAGRYRLLRRLGAGAMGRVWLAYDQELACEVALKEILLPPQLPEPEVSSRIARARREARHAARLRDHPHVVTVHDIVEEHGLPWIVMAFVPGATDLDALVRAGGPLPPAEVARIGLAVLDALGEGHRLGILHRDVKPANILLAGPAPTPRTGDRATGGRVLLADYGIALQQDSGATRLTDTAKALGTPAYMAPERAHGGPPTPASDLFGLGATLYFAVEGTNPFDRGSDVATLVALLFNDPTPPRRAADLTPVLLGLLAKDPAQRMDGDEAADRLAPIAAPPPPPSPPAESPPLAPKRPPPEERTEPRKTTVPPSLPTTSPAESEEETAGEAPPPPRRAGGATRLSPGPPRLWRRRAWLIAGVVLLVLAAVGGGLYLTQSRSPSPEPAATPPTTALPTAPASVSSVRVGSGPEGVALSPDRRRAYVANSGSGSVSVIDTTTNRTVGDPIEVGESPTGVAVSRDGRQVYVTNFGSYSVSVIDTATNRTVGDPIEVGVYPVGVALSPDGRRAYVTNSDGSAVSVIDTATNRTVGDTIDVGESPYGVALSPDGRRAYVANSGSGSVSVIDTATNRTVGDPIDVGESPDGVALSPDGRRAYVANSGSGSVSVIDTATNHTVGDPIAVGSEPGGVAVSRDGRRVYVTNYASNSVSVIDAATNRTVGDPIRVKSPNGVTVSPDGRRVYVTNYAPNSVSVIEF